MVAGTPASWWGVCILSPLATWGFPSRLPVSSLPDLYWKPAVLQSLGEHPAGRAADALSDQLSRCCGWCGPEGEAAVPAGPWEEHVLGSERQQGVLQLLHQPHGQLHGPGQVGTAAGRSSGCGLRATSSWPSAFPLSSAEDLRWPPPVGKDSHLTAVHLCPAQSSHSVCWPGSGAELNSPSPLPGCSVSPPIVTLERRCDRM